MKSPNEINSEIVKQYGMDEGANVVGVASSKDFDSVPEGFKPSNVMKNCCSVIVLGATFDQEVLNSIDEYSASRNTMLTKMTKMAKEVSKRIKADAYKIKHISAAGGKWVEGDGKKEFLGLISLKHAAEIAGLGGIGKNYLLTNPKYGNFLWFSAVLTDAELIPDEKLQLIFVTTVANVLRHVLLEH